MYRLPSSCRNQSSNREIIRKLGEYFNLDSISCSLLVCDVISFMSTKLCARRVSNPDFSTQVVTCVITLRHLNA